MIGFGISDHQSFKQATAYADGAIIGSAFINVLKNSGNIDEDIIKYVRSVKGK
jgi:tryptophan synthase alpha chain